MAVHRAWSGHVEPDYFQFYVRRAAAEWVADEVPEDGYRDHLWSNGQFVYVGTLRKFGPTPVDVEVLTEEPGAPASRWQHVTEASLDAGGPIEVFRWPGDEPVTVISVPETPLRLRVQWTGLVAGMFEGMEEDGSSDEHLELKAWPAPVAASAVLQRWDGWPW